MLELTWVILRHSELEHCVNCVSHCASSVQSLLCEMGTLASAMASRLVAQGRREYPNEGEKYKRAIAQDLWFHCG